MGKEIIFNLPEIEKGKSRFVEELLKIIKDSYKDAYNELKNKFWELYDKWKDEPIFIIEKPWFIKLISKIVKVKALIRLWEILFGTHPTGK